MKTALKKLAQLVDGKVIGDDETVVTGVAGIQDATEGDITYLSHLKYAVEVGKTRASAMVLAKEQEGCSLPMIIVENPLYAFSLIVSHFHAKSPAPKGVNPRANIGQDVILGKDISIYPFVVIGDRAKIGNRVSLYPGVFCWR